MTTTDAKLVRLGSHRAASKVELIVGGKLDWHFTWADGGTFALIPAEHVDAALAVTGVTRARPKGDVKRCHPM